VYALAKVASQRAPQAIRHSEIRMIRTGWLSVVAAVVGVLTVAGARPAVAAELNCTGGASGCAGGTLVDVGGVSYWDFAGALWTTADNHPTSGVVDTFVRIQDTNASTAGVVDGMNTSAARPLDLNDEVDSATLTHDIRGNQLRAVTIDGTQYYEFLLDISQPTSDPLVSLDGLQICVGSSGQYFDGTCDPAGSSATALKYNLDATNANSVMLSSGVNNGNLFVYIPTATLTVGVTGFASKYVYLWSSFGTGDDNDQLGYEDWSLRQTTVVTSLLGASMPEPASLLLLGTGLVMGSGILRRKRKKAAAKVADDASSS
jgi:hypothetical protein